jgi:hypothetical protein
MKGSTRRQKCELTNVPVVTPDLKTKCVTVLVYEEKGKTVLQPLATEQETQTLQELFQKNTLEVWLSNGKSNADEYDVSILKYKPQVQQSTFANVSKPKKTFFPFSSCIGKNQGLKGLWRFHY